MVLPNDYNSIRAYTGRIDIVNSTLVISMSYKCKVTATDE